MLPSLGSTNTCCACSVENPRCNTVKLVAYGSEWWRHRMCFCDRGVVGQTDKGELVNITSDDAMPNVESFNAANKPGG